MTKKASLNLPKIARGRLGLLQLKMNYLIMFMFLVGVIFVKKIDWTFVKGESPVVIGSLAYLVIISVFFSVFQHMIHKFKPDDALDAKRLNEQLKLMASGINTVAAAFVTVLAIAKFQEVGINTVLLAGGAGLWVHMGARGILLHLKDETASAYPILDQSSVLPS